MRTELKDEIREEIREEVLEKKEEILEKHNAKVTFFKSIGMKISLLVICATLLTGLIASTVYISVTKKECKTLTSNNMGDLSTAYAKILNNDLKVYSEITYDHYHDLLGSVKVKGMPSSYAYLVDEKGVMLYHPTKEKVGNQVENEVVKGLVAKLEKGEKPADDVVTYVYKGASKLAGYSILNNNSILVVTCDEDDAYSFMSTVYKITAILIAGIIIVFTITGYIFAKFMIKPMGIIKDLINETADFNFASKNRMSKMQKRTDEIGSIAKSLKIMRDNLRDVVGDISAAGDTLESSVNDVEREGNEIDTMCTDTSATTEELAAGMQETTAATETIQIQIEEMQEKAGIIKDLSASGEKQSEEISDRAEKLNDTTKKASDRTTALYEDMKQKTEKAINDSKAVEKINELTGAIMAISSQTSLLALNANIEAARAGEAGRGFAVVATEIGSLASQTSDAVGNINEIVAVVNEVVSRMADTLTESIQFLENVVIKDYDQFGEVSIQYKNDADTFKSSMEEIENSVEVLNDKISLVADSLQGIAHTIGEATVGVTEIAGKTSDITNSTAANKDAVEECLEAVNALKEITKKFSLG